MAVKRQDGAGESRKMRADGVRNRRRGGGSRRSLRYLLVAEGVVVRCEGVS